MYKARLHCPVDNIQLLHKGIHAQDVQMKDDIIFICQMNVRILLIENQVGSISTKIVKARKKTELQAKANSFSLSSRGTVKEFKDRIEKNYENVKTLYMEKNFDVNILNFWDFGPSEQPLFGAIACINSSLIYAARKHASEIVKLTLKKDGFGVRTEISEDGICYDPDWNYVQSMCYVENELFLSTTEGIFVIELKNKTLTSVLKAPSSSSRFLTTFKEGALYSDEDEFTIFQVRKDKSIVNFAGTGTGGNLHQLVNLCSQEDYVLSLIMLSMFVIHKLAVSNYFLQWENVASISKPLAICTMHFQSRARVKDTV